MIRRFGALGAVALVLALAGAGGAASASTFKVIHVFQGGTVDGANPVGNLIIDADGNLYGATEYGGPNILGYGCGQDAPEGCGTVYMLSPPSAGQTEWSENIIHTFSVGNSGPDGALPTAGVIMDGSGALYGTTAFGGVESKKCCDAGVVFKLTPPAAGQSSWNETIIYDFTQFESDGKKSQAPVTLGVNGALYGTSSSGGLHGSGTVFKLTPPASGTGEWTEAILYNFKNGTDGANPVTGVFLDSAGNVYGNTSVAFKLSPPGAGAVNWTFKPIYSAETVAGLTVDSAGDFYGLGSSVFRLTKPVSGTSWHPTQLYTFGTSPPDASGPADAPTIGADGNLYYTTRNGGYYNYGGVFKLTKPKAGGTWTETRLYSFALNEKGYNPQGGVVIDAKGNIFGTAYLGGNSKDPNSNDPGDGVVWEISP